MFPTNVAVALAKASEIDDLFADKLRWEKEFGHFQRLAMVSDYDTAFKALNPFLTRKPSKQQIVSLKLIHSLAKTDVLGLAVEKLEDIVGNQKHPAKDKIAAAAILNELYGEKHIIEDVKLTDKLVVNLGGKEQ